MSIYPVTHSLILLQIPFIALQVPIRHLLRRILPAAWYERANVGIMIWELEDKNRTHEKFGSAFILVTAGMNQLYCADAEMANVILARRKDFIQLPVASIIMGFLGQNILTVGFYPVKSLVGSLCGF